MSFLLKYSFCQNCECDTAVFSDTTGQYNAQTNPTGYNGPNGVYNSDIRSVEISITPPSYQNPIVFNFDLNPNGFGEVTSATRTDQYGDVTPIDPDSLSTKNYPFYNLEFDSILLFGDTTKSDLEDGTWTVEYSITDTVSNPDQVYESKAYNYFICKATQCKNNAAIKYPKGEITKERAIDIFLNYNSLLTAIVLQNNQDVNNQSAVILDLCKGCGCC